MQQRSRSSSIAAQHARPQHLDRDLAAVLAAPRSAPARSTRWPPARRRSSRRPRRSAGRTRASTSARATCAAGNGGTRSCSLRQLVGDVGRQQVAPRRQHLAELDEDRAQPLQRQAQPHAARRVEPAADRDHATSSRDPALAEARQRELVQPVAQYRDEMKTSRARCLIGAARRSPSRRRAARPSRRQSPRTALRSRRRAGAVGHAQPRRRRPTSLRRGRTDQPARGRPATSQRRLSISQLTSAANCGVAGDRRPSALGRRAACAPPAAAGLDASTSHRRSGPPRAVGAEPLEQPGRRDAKRHAGRRRQQRGQPVEAGSAQRASRRAAQPRHRDRLAPKTWLTTAASGAPGSDGVTSVCRL